jgi:hypothetical protein
MENHAPADASWSSSLAGLAGLVAALGLGYLALSQQLPAPAARPLKSFSAPPMLAPCTMDRGGYLTGRIFAATAVDIDWSGNALTCAGNARPDGQGLRLFFAGRLGAGDDRLVLVLGIAAGVADLPGREHPVSLTLIDEASSQFFHSQPDRCFTHIREVTPLDGTRADFRVEGDLYCAGAIASVTGSNSVTLGDIAFAGRLTLEGDGG